MAQSLQTLTDITKQAYDKPLYKTIGLLTTLLVLSGTIFLTYESITSHFELQKLEASVKLLKDIKSTNKEHKPYVDNVKKNILVSLQEITKKHTYPRFERGMIITFLFLLISLPYTIPNQK